MAGLTHYIGDEELSTDPAAGIISGDDAPGSTQAGVLTRLARMSDQVEADYDTASTGIKQVFDAHDHTTGGEKLGTGGVVSLATGAITQAKIDANAVTAAKVANDAITTAKIQDNSITQAKVGDASHVSAGSLGAGGTYNWSPPTPYPLFHIEGAGSYEIEQRSYNGSGTIDFVNTSGGAISFTIVYRGSD